MSKRRRNTVAHGHGAGRRSARPINKEIVGIVNTASSAAQSEQQVWITTYPATIVGIRWEMSAISNIPSTNTSWWALVVVREGDTPNIAGLGPGTTLYKPEQDVMTWDIMTLASNTSTAGPVTHHQSGSTKTMRRLQGGDKIVFITDADQVNATLYKGFFQFFIKSGS